MLVERRGNVRGVVLCTSSLFAGTKERRVRNFVTLVRPVEERREPIIRDSIGHAALQTRLLRLEPIYARLIIRLLLFDGIARLIVGLL